MNLLILENYDEMSKAAANIVKETIKQKSNSVLGLATGSTPIGMYQELIKMNKEGNIDFSKVTTVNLDEYIGLGASDDQSYRYFMNKNLFDHINIDKSKTFIPNGLTKDAEEEGRNYDNKIEELGGIDLQILGIGNNGHIAFNEPSDFLICGTHLTNLTESTINANSRCFKSRDEVPKTALTMGIKQIMKAKKILLLVKGEDKAAVTLELLSGKITTNNPATMLNMHNDVTILIDKRTSELIK